MRVLICLLCMWHIQAIEVTGGHRTVVAGQTVDLPCKLGPTGEELTQITWQRRTRQIPENDNFYVISPRTGANPVNGGQKDADRFVFIGSMADTNGSILLRDARLLDEGTYTCIFTLFPSGPFKAEIHLTVLVPPIVSVIVDVPPVEGDGEVAVATCVAANAKPEAEVRWGMGALSSRLRTVTNSTQHDNGTTTVISHLLAVPSRDADQKPVECVVTQPALQTERILPYRLNISYPPSLVNISVTSSQTFRCVADGNPTPRYTWNRPLAAFGEDGYLTVSLNGLYTCEASNTYGTSVGSLYVHTSDSCSTCCILGILLLCMVVAAAGLASGCYIYRKRHGSLPWCNGKDMQSDRRKRHEHKNQPVSFFSIKLHG